MNTFEMNSTCHGFQVYEKYRFLLIFLSLFFPENLLINEKSATIGENKIHDIVIFCGQHEILKGVVAGKTP